MPTECERRNIAPAQVQQQRAQQQSQQSQQQEQQQNYNDDDDDGKMLEDQDLNGDMSTSQTSTTSSNGCNGNNSSVNNSGGRKTSLTSPDPTAYVAKARVTRPTPPPPSSNPMQFVQIKPCNLYQTAQQQLKKAEEVKKIKEIKKEEPEEWQNNLDNWKSSRRKRVEHIIDRVVEVKKLELEEHDRSRRKSKTFSEMIEERGERGPRARTKLASLAVYNEDESNDLSDLGIGTSSASGKSSLSEDYDNNSVLSDNAELDRAIFENNHQQHNHHKQNSTTREYISSPGYDTSSSTAPGSSPDPCEYTYEGAIQDYKQRVSRAATTANNPHNNTTNPTAVYKLNNNANNNNIDNDSGKLNMTNKESLHECARNGEIYPTRRGSKIEDRLMSFEVTSPSDSQEFAEKHKVVVPKIDISKRKEMFEQQSVAAAKQDTEKVNTKAMGVGIPKVTLRERFKFDAASGAAGNGNNNTQLEAAKKEMKRFSGDLTSIKERLQSLEQQKQHTQQQQQQQNLVNLTNGAAGVAHSATAKMCDIPVPPLKERLSSLHNAVTKEEVKKAPVVLIDARQLEIMKNEEANAQQRLKLEQRLDNKTKIVTNINKKHNEQQTNFIVADDVEVDCDDSGIHTADDNDVEQQQRAMTAQEDQLNAAIAALAIEEKQLEQAANAVNQIEAEFAELTNATAATTTTTNGATTNNEQPCEMEFSINEALEMALEAIDKETTKITTEKSIAKSNEAELKIEIKNDKIKVNKQKQQNLNKTDEEKELKLKKPQMALIANADNNDNDDNDNDNDDNVEDDEVKISKEPIYENISTASTPELDAEAVIIIPKPNNSNIKHNYKLKLNDNNKNQTEQQQQQHDDYNNKSIKNNNNNQMMKKPNALETATANLILNEQQSSGVATCQTATVNKNSNNDIEPYYQVPTKTNSIEPYYDAPKHLRPIPVYENIEIFYTGIENATLSTGVIGVKMEPPREKPPPPPVASPPHFDDADSVCDMADTWSSDNTYETIATRLPQKQRQQLLQQGQHNNVELPSPPMKRMNSTKRIKKELRNKRSSFLGIEGSHDDDEEERFLELTVAPPPDMAQLLQEERRLEKQLYLKAAALCDSSDTGESRDSGVSENHSRQSSEHYTNSSEENERHIESPPHQNKHHSNNNDLIYQNEPLLSAAQTPLLQTVKGNSAESWTESATAAAAATKSLTEATATANAKMLSIEEKIREQEEVLRVERELLQLEQEELKRQRENLMLRENMARRELQHGAKMLMSANRRSLQDLNGVGVIMPATVTAGNGSAFNVPLPHQYVAKQQTHHALYPLPTHQQQQQQQQQQQIYANLPNPHQNYYQVAPDYRKSMSDLNEFSKRLLLPPTPPTKPMRALHTTLESTSASNSHDDDFEARQRHALNTETYGGSLVKIATPNVAPRSHIYSNYQHQSAQNLSNIANVNGNAHNHTHAHTHVHAHSHGNMTRNTLHALSATPKPKYTDGWVQVQNRKSLDTNLTKDHGWLSAYDQERKALNNHWLVQEAEQRRVAEQQQRRSISSGNAMLHQQQQQQNGSAKTSVTSNGKPLPDSVIQTLTERVQNKGIGERKRFEQYNNADKSPLHAVGYQQQQQHQSSRQNAALPTVAPTTTTQPNSTPDKVLSVSGKKKCSHCGDELGRGAAMIIESLLLFYHISCFKCCVCHVQLGDGLNGTDVRVRNHKLHCQNCYSSDDGIKFSCV